MAQAYWGPGIKRPVQVKPLFCQHQNHKNSQLRTDKPFLSVIKLEQRRNDSHYDGSKPKSSTPLTQNQAPQRRHFTDFLNHEEEDPIACVNTDRAYRVFCSVREARKTLSHEGSCVTPLVCLEDVRTSFPDPRKSVSSAHVNKLMNRSHSDIQKQHQENFEAELKKRLQRKSPVNNPYKDSSMEGTEAGCSDVYCDTPVKQNPGSAAKGKPKSRKKTIEGQSPKTSPVKKSPQKNSASVASGDGIEELRSQETKHTKGKKKGKASPAKKEKASVAVTLGELADSSTPVKQVTKRKKPKVKIDHGTPDIEASSTSYTPSPDSSSKKPSLKLTTSGLCTPKELYVQTNHGESYSSSVSVSKDSACLENSDSSEKETLVSLGKDSRALDSPSSLSPSKELGRRIRAPNMRYSDDILLLPLRSPRRSRSPKGSAEKEGGPGIQEETPQDEDSTGKVKKSDDGQTSQLYSLLTNRGHASRVLVEKPFSEDSEQRVGESSVKDKDDLSCQKSSELLTNGLVDGLELKPEKSSEKNKKKRKKKSDSDETGDLKTKSVEKSDKKKTGSGPKVKSPTSAAVRALQFDEAVENTQLKMEEDSTVKLTDQTKGKKTSTPRKPRKTTEKGKKSASKASPDSSENNSVNQSVDTTTPRKSKSVSESNPTVSGSMDDSNGSKSLDLFSLIAKVKNSMNAAPFPEFADEVLLIAEEEDTGKEDLGEGSETAPKSENVIPEKNSQDGDIVDDFFSADFLKVSPKRIVKSPAKEIQNPGGASLSEDLLVKKMSGTTGVVSSSKGKKTSLETVEEDLVSSTNACGVISCTRAKTSGEKSESVKDKTMDRFDWKRTDESVSSSDPTAPLMIDTQERRNIFDAIMTDYPSPKNAKENTESAEKSVERAELDTSRSDLQAHCDSQTVSPKVGDSMSISLHGDKSIVEKIQVKLGIPVEETVEKPNKYGNRSKCSSPVKQTDNVKSSSKLISSPAKKTVPCSKVEEERDHNSTKGSSDFEIVMDTVDDHPLMMDGYSDATPSPSPEEERACPSRPVPRTSTQRVTKEPAPLSVLSSIEGEVMDKMSAFTSSSLNEYLDTKTNRRVKLSRPVKLNDSEERLVEDSEDEMEEVAEMPEQYNEFSGMIEQCEPSFDEVDGVLFTSFLNEEALNAHVKVERKSKIGKNESILLGMARMRNLRERQNQIRNSVQKKKDARLKALKEQYKINQSLQGMHLVLMKYQRLFKRELILELMAKEQDSPGSIRGKKTPKKTSDITQIKGWKHKFGADDDSLDMKANMGKLHWRTEERLLRNHDPAQLKEMGLELKKKRRKNLVFTIRKGMSKGDPSRMERVELAAQGEGDEEMEGEMDRQDGESSLGQEFIEMGYEIIDSEKQKLRDKKQREKYKKYLMVKLKLNGEDIDILKKLGGQRLRGALKPESPKKQHPAPQFTPPHTVEGDREGETTKDSVSDSPSKKKRKRKKNYFNIVTLNSSMATAAVTALHPKYTVKKKKAKSAKIIKQEPVDPEFDTMKIEEDEEGGHQELKVAKMKKEAKSESEAQSKEVFDKMCDKPDDTVMLFDGGCRYGCICHLCRFSGDSSDSVDKLNKEKKCTKEYCRLGCICDDSHDKAPKQHCGRPECMIECSCDPIPAGRHSRSSSQGEPISSGGNSEDNQSNPPPEEFLIKKASRKNEAIPRRKSTYRLAKNLDAVSRKAMLVYEASEKYETQKTRTRRKQDFGEGISIPVTETRQQAIVSAPSATHASVTMTGLAPLQKKPLGSLTPHPTPALPMSGAVTLGVTQSKAQQPPNQAELFRRFMETSKPQQKKLEDDSEMALFDSDSEGEDFSEVTSCARVDAQYTRSSHPKKCTCGKDHIQSRAVSSQCLPPAATTAGQSASSGLSVLQQKLTGKMAEAVWQTQWVCLKSNKPPTEKEGQAVKLLEILSNCNWEPHKQKILSRISRQISQGTGDKHFLSDGYPPPCLIHIGEFEIEFLPKSNKPATIPPEVRNNMPSVIFSIRVRISNRDLTFPKLFKALPLSSTSKTVNTSSPDQITVSSSSQATSVATTDSGNNKSGLSVTGISGFSRLQINNHSIQKDASPHSDRSHLHLISTQQMMHMKPSQLLTSIQTLTSTLTLQSGVGKTLAPHTSTLTKVMSVGPTVSPVIHVTSTASPTTTTMMSLTSIPSSKVTKTPQTSSIISSISHSGATTVLKMSALGVSVASTATPQKSLLVSTETPSLSVPSSSLDVKASGLEPNSSTDTLVVSSPVCSVQTLPVPHPISVTATSIVTVTTSITSSKLVSAAGLTQRKVSPVSKTTISSLQSALQNKDSPSSSSSSNMAAKLSTTSPPITIISKPSSVSEIRGPLGHKAMQVNDLRPPASLSISQVQEKVCVLGPKSSPVTLLGPFTSPSSIPKVLPQMKIVQSSILDKGGKPVMHLVPFTGTVCGKSLPMTSIIKNAPMGSSQQASATGVIKNPTNVYTLSDVSTTTTSVVHTTNASTTVTQSTVPAMSEKIQGPMLPQLGDQILLVSSDENNIKLLNKLKKSEGWRNPTDSSSNMQDSNKPQHSNKLQDSNTLPDSLGKQECNSMQNNILQDSLGAEQDTPATDATGQSPVEGGAMKRKLDVDKEEEKCKKLKTGDGEELRVVESSRGVKEEDSVLAKILLSDAVKETYTKYRDIPVDSSKKQPEPQTLNKHITKGSETGSKDQMKVCKDEEGSGNGSVDKLEAHQEDGEMAVAVESESVSQGNRGEGAVSELDSSGDRSDVSDVTVVGGVGPEGEREESAEDEDQSTTDRQYTVKQENDHPEVIHILDSPVKKVSGEKISVASSEGNPQIPCVNGFDQEAKVAIKRRMSQEDEEHESSKKLRTQAEGEESEEDLCMTVEDTDDMAVIIPNDEDCVEIINSSDEDIDVETETETNMNKLLRKQSDTAWEFFNPHCNVHCISKKPHAKRKTSLQPISNAYQDDVQFKESKTRQAFPAKEKLRVIAFAENHGNRAAEREFAISEANIRLWRRQKERLEQLPRTKMAERGRCALFPQIETELLKWVTDRRQQGSGVTIAELRTKALSIAKNDPSAQEFKASVEWCYAFLNRQNSFEQLMTSKGLVNEQKSRRVQQKKTREKQRREEMRQAFKTLAESMYGEDKDNTKYSQILNHTEPKVQLLNRAKEKIAHMEEIDRLMVSESQSTQARNTLLKNQLQSLKDYIIKERGMSWMVLQAHLDKIAKVCKKIFQNMPAILKKRAMERRASAGSAGSASGGNQQSFVQYPRSGGISRPPASATATNGPVPIQLVSSEQVRTMAKNKELARARENMSGRPDIYIDYAEEENEICEDLMRREEKNRRKQIHTINDDMAFEIGDLPNLFKKTDFSGSFLEDKSKFPKSDINISESDEEKVIIGGDFRNSGKSAVYNPIVEVPMNNSGKIASLQNLQEEAKRRVRQLEGSRSEEETPMLLITEVKSLSSDS